MSRHHHADTHGLTMQPLAIAQARFDRMPESVAKIQDSTQPGVTLVLSHHPGLDFTTAFDGVRECCRFTCHQGNNMVFDPGKKVDIGNWTVLDDFGQSGTELTLRQRLERTEITHDLERLVKRTNHVLAQRMVDAGFAAN